MTTEISWTWVPDGKGGRKKGETWNPQVGCSEVSPGCKHCYAAKLAHRGMSEQHRGLTKGLPILDANGNPVLDKHGNPKIKKGSIHWDKDAGVRHVPHLLSQPLKWREPRGVFVGSMTDLFHESNMTDEGRMYIAAVYGVALVCPQHTFMMLTKRPRLMRDWYEWAETRAAKMMTSVAEACVLAANEVLRQSDPEIMAEGAEMWDAADRLMDRWMWADQGDYGFEAMDDDDARDIERRIARAKRDGADDIESDEWPPKNVWVGTTTEDQQRADERIPELLRVDAAVRFLSVEPMLGPVDVGRWVDRGCVDYDHVTGSSTASRPSIDWVICGGESGPGARPMHPDWVRDVRDQCEEAGVPFLFKQWGSHAPWMTEDWFTHGGKEVRAHTWVALDGSHGSCWPIDSDGTWSDYTGNPPLDTGVGQEGVMSKVGKGKAGRELDGRTWDQFPETT